MNVPRRQSKEASLSSTLPSQSLLDLRGAQPPLGGASDAAVGTGSSNVSSVCACVIICVWHMCSCAVRRCWNFAVSLCMHVCLGCVPANSCWSCSRRLVARLMRHRQQLKQRTWVYFMFAMPMYVFNICACLRWTCLMRRSFNGDWQQLEHQQRTCVCLS